MMTPPTAGADIPTEMLSDLAEAMHTARYRAAVEGDLTIDDEDADPLCEEEQAVAGRAEANGLTHLGTGAGRVVFAIDDEYVVKFARYGEDDLTDGVQQNHRERRIYEEVGDDFRILPVIETGANDKWLVMPRVEPMGDSPELVGDPDLTDLVEHLAPLYEYIHSPEVNPENVAYYNGELHLFDYGRPRIPLDEV